jgi:hypothetical protein
MYQFFLSGHYEDTQLGGVYHQSHGRQVQGLFAKIKYVNMLCGRQLAA